MDMPDMPDDSEMPEMPYEYVTCIDVPSGYKVQMILKDPTHHNAAGQLCVDPSALEWVDMEEWRIMPFPSMCEHFETMCSDCLDTWQIDWIVRIVKDTPKRVN